MGRTVVLGGSGTADSVTGVVPSYGATAGSTSVTVSGTGFADITADDVYFGDSHPTNVANLTSTSFTCDTPAGSGSVTVSVADKSLGNAFIYAVPYLNEPVGCTRVFEHDFSSVPTVGGDAGLIYGACDYYPKDGHPFSVGSDGAAPQSPPGVLEMTYWEGLTGGSQIGQWWGWENFTGEGTRRELSTMYVSFWSKINRATMQAPSQGVKLFGFWSVGSHYAATGNTVYPLTQGGTWSSTKIDCVIQNIGDYRVNQTGSGSPPIYQSNLWTDPGAVYTCDEWHHIEQVGILGSAPGVLDGTYKLWIDEVEVIYCNTMRWYTDSNPHGFYKIHWDPIWGGLETTMSADAVHQLDHFYVSGITK